MKFSYHNLLFIVGLLTMPLLTVGQSSVLSQGQWLKVPVSEHGVVRISYSELSSAGFSVADINPATIQVFGTYGGMLPQENDSAVFDDPQELAIQVVTSQPNLFQPGDYLIFYAQGSDYIGYDQSDKTIIYENHLFDNENYYFITTGQQTGKRIESVGVLPGGALLAKGIQYFIHEEDLFNVLRSGRFWYGEKFDINVDQSFEVILDNVAAGTEIKLISTVMSRSTQPASFDVYINSTSVGNHDLPPNPSGTYARKGTVRQDVFSINEAGLGNDPTSVSYTFNKTSGIGHLDYFVLQAETELQYEGELLQFYTGNYASSSNRTVNVSNVSSDVIVWDLTDPLEIRSLDVAVNNGIASFNISEDIEEIAVFSPQELGSISNSQLIDNQNLKAVSQADLLIVTNEEFLAEGEELAALRMAEGITTVVVSDEAIYNEYSSGKKDITAIRNYARHLYQNAGLKYLLLLGKGTYDPKNITETGLDKLPIYQSRNSLFPLATYASDDYLGFMEDNEGYWEENNDDDHTMDIGVGRIPARTVEELATYIEKLKTYQGKTALGDWRQEVVFVAEDGDGNIHQRDAERLATLIDTTYEAFTTKKIYVDAYPIEVNPGSKRAPEANKEIYEAINSGSLIVNYTGHGNENVWANTRIFDLKTIDSLLNDTFLPLFVTATCEFGRHDDTGPKSGGEKLLLDHETGAIATITTARPVFASSNYQLNLAFYNTVFERLDGSYQRMGDIFKTTKNNSLNGVLNRNFSFLGDPSMLLSYGEQFITLDQLNGEDIVLNDTLRTLELLDLEGSIRTGNETVDASFEGVAEIKLFGRSSKRQTLGNLGQTPFSYSVRDNLLFSGSATINKGKFNFSTVLPKDISYNPASARVVLYARRSDATTDASGANIDFLIGTSSSNSIVDTMPPEIYAYIGDTTFTNGDIVNDNSLLVVNLFDEYGINTSTSQVGHSITYQLDDDDPVTLNQYYRTEKDDFRSGWIYFNLPQLSPGKHRILVTAWDTSNNSNSEEVEFTVVGNNEIVITDLSNYPNPLKDLTNFTFSHNLGGEDIVVTLEIISVSGQKVFEEVRSYESAPGTISDWQWDARNTSGAKLIAGVYIYGVFVRSNSSTNVQNQYSRLLISN